MEEDKKTWVTVAGKRLMTDSDGGLGAEEPVKKLAMGAGGP